MNPGRLYDGRRQYQGRRPPRTPSQGHGTGFVILFVFAAVCCFCGGGVVAAALWLLGWIQV